LNWNNELPGKGQPLKRRTLHFLTQLSQQPPSSLTKYFIENGSINEIFLLHIFIDSDGTRVVAVKVASLLSGGSPGAATSETNFFPPLLINELLVSGRFCAQDIEQRQKRWTQAIVIGLSFQLLEQTLS
jgi:hypothetical protein